MSNEIPAGAATSLKRPYRLSRRAQSQAATRQRIVEAIAALHEEIGPARTTISAIAERAGVEQLTVYRHFPDELSQFVACASHWQQDHPAPTLERWMAITDPVQRLRAALEELYAYYAAGEPMLSMVLRDAGQLPDLQKVMEPFSQYLEAVVQLLSEPWKKVTEGRMLTAAIGLAVQFSTWRSLTMSRQLSEQEAVELMLRLVRTAAMAE